MASIMGESGDIFFPKLDEEKDMIPFDRIALDLLKTLGLEADICQSEEEAREKATRRQSDWATGRESEEAKRRESEEARKRGSEEAMERQGEDKVSHSRTVAQSQKYPIFFFGSNTSGEKAFEEFFTEKEELDNDSFINLGVIKNSVKRDIKEIDTIFEKLRQLFESESVTKAAIVEILKVYLPNFEHIETGKGLDSKM